ncbi:hypothetical protein CSA37_01715 [Candidatus Fermentibacteria bacterium]|nr:MAG: hypothetical protein CSA37_01715 [Candidatus Fermentibacteria bacterium]
MNMRHSFWGHRVIKGKFLTAANCISIARIPLAGIAALMLVRGSVMWTAVFIVIASLTDVLDGFIARKTGTVSDWGKILDPAADKISFAVMAVTMVFLGLIPSWILWILVCRDGLIALGGILMSSGAEPPLANCWGKASTFFLALYILRQVIFPEYQLFGHLFEGADLLGLISVALIVYSFFTYVAVFIASRGEH